MGEINCTQYNELKGKLEAEMSRRIGGTIEGQSWGDVSSWASELASVSSVNPLDIMTSEQGKLVNAFLSIKSFGDLTIADHNVPIPGDFDYEKLKAQFENIESESMGAGAESEGSGGEELPSGDGLSPPARLRQARPSSPR